MIAALLAELRASGVELQLVGGKLRVFGARSAYSARLRAQILANKSAILAHLRREEQSGDAAFDRAERAWAAEYLTHMALAHGFPEKLVLLAAQIVGNAPARSPFRVGRDLVTISIGEGIQIRVHRTQQPWVADESQDHPARAPAM